MLASIDLVDFGQYGTLSTALNSSLSQQLGHCGVGILIAGPCILY